MIGQVSINKHVPTRTVVTVVLVLQWMFDQFLFPICDVHAENHLTYLRLRGLGVPFCTKGRPALPEVKNHRSDPGSQGLSFDNKLRWV